MADTTVNQTQSADEKAAALAYNTKMTNIAEVIATEKELLAQHEGDAIAAGLHTSMPTPTNTQV
jgi:hypothetical protein